MHRNKEQGGKTCTENCSALVDITSAVWLDDHGPIMQRTITKRVATNRTRNSEWHRANR